MAGSQGQASQFCLCGPLGCPGCRIPSDTALGRGVSSPTGKAQSTRPLCVLEW